MFKRLCPVLGDYIASHAAARPDAVAIVAHDGRMTWRDFDLATKRVANALHATGLDTGDRLGILMSNGCAMAQLVFGSMRAGLIVVPLNTMTSDETVGTLLADAGVAAVAATPDHASRITSLKRSVPHILAGGAHPGGERDGWIDFDAWRDAHDALPPPPVDPDAPCNIIYSSGTTGHPKGIVHSHRARLDWAYDLALALHYHGTPRTLIATGLYSNISWVGMLSTILLGGTLFVMKCFDPGAALRAIADDRITNLSMVPVQFQRMLDHPDFAATDTSSMVAMMCCGSPLPAGVKDRLLREFDCGVTELYGLTEGIATTLDPADACGRLASVGRPLQGSDIRLVDEEGREVKAGQTGEIVARSRFMMLGYWNNPAATADTTWSDPEGRAWLRSGDIGRFDADGFLTIVDRKKDMILSGGQNIFPADIEAVLLTHPDVAECAVIGIPSAVWGETPLALVIRVPGAVGDGDLLKAWLNDRLGKQQRVHAVELLDTLPRNANGKVLKAELRKAYAAAGAIAS